MRESESTWHVRTADSWRPAGTNGYVSAWGAVLAGATPGPS